MAMSSRYGFLVLAVGVCVASEVGLWLSPPCAADTPGTLGTGGRQRAAPCTWGCRPPNRSAEIVAAGTGSESPWIRVASSPRLEFEWDDENPRSLPDPSEPLSLTAADFDGDGVPDLAAGYKTGSRGLLLLFRGNVDSIFPQSGEAERRKRDGTFTDAPFLSPVRALTLPEPPDFLAAGDFAVDGRQDLVAAARGSNVLWWVSGDGSGGLGLARRTLLPGSVTALAGGEVNRADGLADVVLAISGPSGSRLLVFESPRGAMAAVPESVVLPAEGAALALGQLDVASPGDVAVACGDRLLIVHGRDRKLSLDRQRRASVPAPTVAEYPQTFVIRDLAIGDFVRGEEHRMELALLAADGTVHLRERAATDGGWIASVHRWPAVDGSSSTARVVRSRTSARGADDLILLDAAERKLAVLALGEPGPVELAVVDQPVAALPMRLNPDALSDLVMLVAGGLAPAVAMTRGGSTFVVDSGGDGEDCDPDDGICSTGEIVGGECELTFECTLNAAIQQANASPGLDSIGFAVASVNLLVGLSDVEGPVVFEGGGVTVHGSGLRLTFGNSTVRDMVIQDEQNFFSAGVWLGGPGNFVEGSLIGTDVSGSVARPNFRGVGGPSAGNTIGGTVAAARNVISGNLFLGIDLTGAANVVRGNYIGTDASGTLALPNDGGGVSSFGSQNVFGGTAAGAGNLISGNGFHGLEIAVGTGSLIQGNLIGTDAGGAAALGNGTSGTLGVVGVLIGGSDGNTVGGTAPGARNVISGNPATASGGGLAINPDSSGNLVQGNLIGTDTTGTRALGNVGSGVLIRGEGNNVGGSAPGAGNVISATEAPFDGDGLVLAEGSGHLVLGNLIGTDVTGTLALPNARHGLWVARLFAAGNTVGGSEEGAGNSIAFNGGHGIWAAGSDNAFVANGIFSNGGHGVAVTDESGNTLSASSIFDNVGLGIDLGDDGVTANDAGDLDGGANNQQNFPVLVSSSINDPFTAVAGDLDSAPGGSYRIEFFASPSCDPSGHGEGRAFLGSTEVTTDASGHADYSFEFEGHVGELVTATATDLLTGDTSEFSSCLLSSCDVDADCDDGQFCNGTETCPAGSCQAGTPVDCDDGVGCTSDACNETTDSCDNTPDDAACDNGLFCDGAETCAPLLDCLPGSDPCPGLTCDEVNDVCSDLIFRDDFELGDTSAWSSTSP